MLQARGLQRQAEGPDPAAAAALYRRVIALVPRSAEAHLRLSEALMEAGDLDGAVAPARRATELAPRSAEAWAHLGTLQHARGRGKEDARPLAKQALERAGRLLPGDPELWTRLAEVCETLKDEPGALNAWLRVGRMRPPFSFQGRALADVAFERAAYLAFTLGRYEARREAVMALGERPAPDARQLRLLEELARYQVEQGYLGHAEESFRLLGRHLPKEAAVWENVSLIQIRTGRFADALQSLDKARELRASPQVAYQRALALMNLGRLGEAEPALRELLQSPASPEIRTNARGLLGAALLLLDRNTDLLALLADWPVDTSPELSALKAQALLRQEAFREARAVLRQGMARWPERGIFQLARTLPPDRFDEGIFAKKASRQALRQLDLESTAALWADFRRWDRCLQTVQEARRAAPLRDAELLLLEANALQELGRVPEALAVLREGQRLKPGHATLQNNLGYLLVEQGLDLQEGARLIEAALKQEPKNGQTMDSWGWALFKLGRAAEAEKALREAAELAPFSPEIRAHLGEALLKLERLEDALAQWERALAYAFPGRDRLEQRARELRVRIARAQGGLDPVPEADAGDDAPHGEPEGAEDPGEEEEEDD